MQQRVLLTTVLWLGIQAAMANNTGKMSKRDTGAPSDTAGSLSL